MNFLIIKNEQLNCELKYILDEKNELWFRAKTVAEILGYKYPKDAIRDNVDDDDKLKLNDLCRGDSRSPLSHNLKNTIMINESGLYSLILNSKLPTAKKFKRWVTKDVLPTIRKTGSYTMPSVSDRKLKLEEQKLEADTYKIYAEIYSTIHDCRLQTVIKDWLYTSISQQNTIMDESNMYARDITNICKEEFGFMPNHSQKIKIGQVLKKEYLKIFKVQPPKYEKMCNGSMRMVNSYPKDKEKWIINTLQKYDW